MFGLETLTAIAQGKMSLDDMIGTIGKPAMIKAGHKVFMVRLIPKEGKTHKSKNIDDYEVVTEAYKETFEEILNASFQKQTEEIKQKFLELHEFTEALKKEHAELIKLYNAK